MRGLLLLVVLLVLLVGGLWYVFVKDAKVYDAIKDPKPEYGVVHLTKEESEQRLQAKYGFSVDDVRKNKVNFARLRDFKAKVEVADILHGHGLSQQAFQLYKKAAETGSAGEKTTYFYQNFALVAYASKDKAVMTEAYNKAVELLKKQDSMGQAERDYQVEKLTRYQNARLEAFEAEGVN